MGGLPCKRTTCSSSDDCYALENTARWTTTDSTGFNPLDTLPLSIKDYTDSRTREKQRDYKYTHKRQPDRKNTERRGAQRRQRSPTAEEHDSAMSQLEIQVEVRRHPFLKTYFIRLFGLSREWAAGQPGHLERPVGYSPVLGARGKQIPRRPHHSVAASAQPAAFQR